VGDLDGDGDLDLLAAGVTGLVLFQNQGGVFTQAGALAGGPVHDLALGDLDGDGDLDAIAAQAGGSQVWRNDGQLQFHPATLAGAYTARAVALGDLDGDGDLDLYLANSAGDFQGQPDELWRNDGQLGFALAATLGSQDARAGDSRAVALGDLDGDGDLDAFVGVNSGRPDLIWRNDGAFQFVQAGQLGSSDATAVALGDFDGDGDLDAFAANGRGQPDQLWRNGGDLAFSPWADLGNTWSWSAATGDLDGDGDLDLLVGADLGYTVWRNNGQGAFQPSEAINTFAFAETAGVALGDLNGDGALDAFIRDRLYLGKAGGLTRFDIALTQPGPTAAADFFASPAILKGETVAIRYTLFHPASEALAYVRAYYSPNGGGQWLPASAAPGTPLTLLAASPQGVQHTFVWQASADVIKEDHLLFRLEAYPQQAKPGPYKWASAAATTFPMRVEAATWYAKVVDDNGAPVRGAQVYIAGSAAAANDQPVASNRAGLVRLPSSAGSQPLVALYQAHEQPTTRAAHDGWAYRTFLTSFGWRDPNAPQPDFAQTAGEQRLTIHRRQPLILFNLVISVEWDAAESYLHDLALAVRRASGYLFDLSDGQMAYGQVAIYDNSQLWSEADIQVSAHNSLRPHAYIGGITSPDRAKVIRVGRYWDGNGGNQGAWSNPEGHRTLAHEFGHYALHLYDEYIGYQFDSQGNLSGEGETYCTVHRSVLDLSGDDNAAASAMYYQYRTSELSARGVPGLWDPQCEQTAQWVLTGRNTGQSQSNWETIAHRYADSLSPARWELVTPLMRQAFVAGPAHFPADALSLPVVLVHNNGAANDAPYQLTVQGLDQAATAGLMVSLHTNQTTGPRIIAQGFTDASGRLEIYGARPGDRLYAIALDGSAGGEAPVGADRQIVMSILPIRQAVAAAGAAPAKLGAASGAAGAATNGAPYVVAFAEPSSTSDGQIEFRLALHNFSPPAQPDDTPFLFVTTPGVETPQTPKLAYSPARAAYETQISFSAAERGLGRLWIAGATPTGLANLQTTYRLQVVTQSGHQHFFANDGILEVYLTPDSLDSATANVIVMSPGGMPGPPPAGLAPVSEAYALTASGGLTEWQKPVGLTFHYGSLLSGGPPPASLQIYRWQAGAGSWTPVPSLLNAGQVTVDAIVTELGIYALFGSDEGAANPGRLFLPKVSK
jgi:hypothetical protein